MVSANLDEKYKPKSLKELVGQPHVRAKLEQWIHDPNPRIPIPHMLFVGPPGVGKTSAAKAFARDLFGNRWEDNFSSHNASKDRGIDFVRSRVQQLTTMAPAGTKFHIIFLDEADELTEGAQNALKEMIQEYSETAKFILACNRPEKLEKALKDRCQYFYFRPVSSDIMTPRLKYICDKEHITYDDGALELLAENANGSLRQAVILIASKYNQHHHIAIEELEDFDNKIEIWHIEKILTAALHGDTKTAERHLFNFHFEYNIEYGKIFDLILDEVNKMDIGLPLKQAIINETGIYDHRMCDPNITTSVQVRCYINALVMICSNSGYGQFPPIEEATKDEA